LFAGASDQLIELIYDKLLSPSPYVEEPQPWLATEVRQIDPAVWEADLRTDVTWQAGVPFTPKDVVFSFEYMHTAPTGRYTHHVNDTPYVERAVQVDDDTVRFECRDACPSLARVTLADLPIVAEHIWGGVDPAQAKKVQDLPIGTGPYQLTAYSPTEGYTFSANKNYFAGVPTVDTLTMPVITNQSATFTALQSGEIEASTRPRRRRCRICRSARARTSSPPTAPPRDTPSARTRTTSPECPPSTPSPCRSSPTSRRRSPRCSPARSMRRPAPCAPNSSRS